MYRCSLIAAYAHNTAFVFHGVAWWRSGAAAVRMVCGILIWFLELCSTDATSSVAVLAHACYYTSNRWCRFGRAYVFVLHVYHRSEYVVQRTVTVLRMEHDCWWHPWVSELHLMHKCTLSDSGTSDCLKWKCCSRCRALCIDDNDKTQKTWPCRSVHELPKTSKKTHTYGGESHGILLLLHYVCFGLLSLLC